MEHYVRKILRSYLDVEPEKYALPSPKSVDQKRKNLNILIPEVTRVELHEYPKEHVLVLEGENLWFSTKIFLDKGGPNQCEIDNPHNITKCSVQFNFNPSRQASLAIQAGKIVKVTLHTHFNMKVWETVECKKVYNNDSISHQMHEDKINNLKIFSLPIGTLSIFYSTNPTC